MPVFSANTLPGNDERGPTPPSAAGKHHGIITRWQLGYIQGLPTPEGAAQDRLAGCVPDNDPLQGPGLCVGQIKADLLLSRVWEKP